LARTFLLAAAILALAIGHVVAQQTSPGKAPAASTNKSSKDRPTAAPPTAIPSPIELLNLIRTTLLALNQANLIGNYTVLRDLGAPDFQRSNNASVLSDTFRDLRVRRIDLSPVATINPKLVREPSLDAKGLLRLTGFFPSRPQQVNFDLAFQLANGRWRPVGISVSAASIAASGAAVVPEPPQASTNKAVVPPNPSQSPVEKKKTSTPSTSKSKGTTTRAAP
jgi:hypothetical protein